jgi:hypothetical protein
VLFASKSGAFSSMRGMRPSAFGAAVGSAIAVLIFLARFLEILRYLFVACAKCKKPTGWLRVVLADSI